MSFPNLAKSVIPYLVLLLFDLPTYRFLRKKVMWSGIPNSSEFSTVCCDPTIKGFGIVNKTEVYIFLGTLLFF